MVQAKPYSHASSLAAGPRAGQTLVALLVVILIIAILAAIIFPQIAARHHKPGQALTPTERGYQAACGVYEAQINQAIMMYKQDNDDQNPPSLDALKRYGVTNDMIHSEDCVFEYDPSTGVARNAAEGAQGYHGIVNPSSSQQIDQFQNAPAGQARPQNGPPPITPGGPSGAAQGTGQGSPGGRAGRGAGAGNGGGGEINLPGGLHMPNPNGGMGGMGAGDDGSD